MKIESILDRNMILLVMYSPFGLHNWSWSNRTKQRWWCNILMRKLRTFDKSSFLLDALKPNFSLLRIVLALDLLLRSRFIIVDWTLWDKVKGLINRQMGFSLISLWLSIDLRSNFKIQSVGPGPFNNMLFQDIFNFGVLF